MCTLWAGQAYTQAVYSTGNNMDPGPIPTVEDFNFWVNVLQLVTIIIICYLVVLQHLYLAMLLSVHTHHFLLSYNAVFLDVETLHDIALFKIWLTPFAGI